MKQTPRQRFWLLFTLCAALLLSCSTVHDVGSSQSPDPTPGLVTVSIDFQGSGHGECGRCRQPLSYGLGATSGCMWGTDPDNLFLTTAHRVYRWSPLTAQYPLPSEAARPSASASPSPQKI